MRPVSLLPIRWTTVVTGDDSATVVPGLEDGNGSDVEWMDGLVRSGRPDNPLVYEWNPCGRRDVVGRSWWFVSERRQGTTYLLTRVPVSEESGIPRCV